MTRKLIAGLVAASIAFSAAAPASAQQTQQQRNDTIAKIVAGAAGVYVLSRIIKNRRDRDDEASDVLSSRSSVLQDLLTEEDIARQRIIDERRDRIARDESRLDRFDRSDRFERRGDRFDADNCWREKWRGGKWVRHRDGQCMKEMNSRKHRRAEPPRICLRKRWTPDGWDTYYDRRCLVRHGFDGRRDDWRRDHRHGDGRDDWRRRH